MYLLGQGVAQSAGEAAKWFGKASQRGDPKATYSLGTNFLSVNHNLL
jgi:TPR repeat protein